MTHVTLWEKGLRPLGHSSSLCLGPQPCCSAQSQSCTHTHIEAQARRVQDADRHRCISAHWRRRACPHPAAQKTQVSSSTFAAGPAATGISPSRRGQLRIRKRMTPASSSRNFIDGRARPAPVATPDRRRGLSQTNAGRARPDAARSRSSLPDARRSPRPTGCCPRAPCSPSRRRCCRSRAPVPQSTASRRGRPRVESCDARAGPQGRRGGGRGDLQPGRERPVARPAQEPAALGS